MRISHSLEVNYKHEMLTSVEVANANYLPPLTNRKKLAFLIYTQTDLHSDGEQCWKYSLKTYKKRRKLSSNAQALMMI